MPLYLVAGQSNAIFRSSTSQAPELAQPLVGVDHRYWVSTSAGPAVASNAWVTMAPQPSGAFGIERPFASAKGRCAVVQVAQGATDLAVDWAPTGIDNMYDLLVAETLAARATYRRHEVRALVWVQGEDDSSSLAKAQAYGARLAAFAAALRSDLALPTLHVVVLLLHDTDVRPYVAEVRAGQIAFVGGDVHAAIVDADDIPLEAGGVHYADTAAYIALGERLAEAAP